MLEGSGDTRQERHVFQQMALAFAPEGSNIFDFGSGPGLDAKFYAQHGRNVDAYDQEPGMCEYFARYCDEQIREGRVRQRTGTYEEFLCTGEGAWADLITANFAPLNLVANLPALFKRFHEISRTGARVVVSVLNPLCISDCRYWWWWKNLGALVRRGEYYVEGAQGPIFRRSSRRMAEQAMPYFRLVGITANTPRALRDLCSSNAGLRQIGSGAVVVSRYVLLVFERIEIVSGRSSQGMDTARQTGSPSGP
jgi:SAM-dependent methyltransferase